MMEWGIVRGNDPYLYGEKVKAYLRRGARELPGFTEYPIDVSCRRNQIKIDFLRRTVRTWFPIIQM